MLLSIVAIQLVLYGLFEWNLFCYKPFSARKLESYPFVSILVPCRDEAHHIERNMLSLLRQDYPDFEVVIYDDESKDGTGEIIKRLEKDHSHLRLAPTRRLPAGWTGKNHACAMAAEAAKGEWILFVDADTEHKPEMLRRAIQTVVHRDAAFLSTLPRQRFSSWGDELVVPLVYFVLFCFLPMYFVSKKTWKGFGNFSAACGQFLLFRKEVYKEIGGHEAIKDRISEGRLLATSVKAKGHRILLADGSPWVSCSMYHGLREVFEGFSRSVFASMGGSVVAAMFFLIFQTFVFLVPYGTLIFSLLPVYTSAERIGLSLVAILIPLWIRFRIHNRFGLAKRLIFLHAVSLAIYNTIIFNSFLSFKMRKNTVWKKRSYDNPQA